MIQLLLILFGLFSNASGSTTSNCGNNNGPVPTITQPGPTTPTPGGTGGDEGQTPKK